MGAPSTLTQATADEICRRLAEGESLRSICRDPRLPNIRTIYDWRRANPDFDQQYTRAREDQADTYADMIADIADDPELDWQNKRVMIDARKWIASKLKPKTYREGIDHTSSDRSMSPAGALDADALAEQAVRLGIDPSALGLHRKPSSTD